MLGRAQIALVLVVVGLTVMHAYPSPPSVGVNDKLVHAAAYALLGAVLWWALPLPVPWGRAFLVVGAGLLVALALEALQAYVPTRSVSIGDLVADFVGLVLAVVPLAVVTTWRAQRGAPSA